MANFNISNEVMKGEENDWRLCFQFGTYHYDDGRTATGYRFIYRRPDGALQPARGQACLQKEEIFELLSKASAEGWF